LPAPAFASGAGTGTATVSRNVGTRSGGVLQGGISPPQCAEAAPPSLARPL